MATSPPATFSLKSFVGRPQDDRDDQRSPRLALGAVVGQPTAATERQQPYTESVVQQSEDVAGTTNAPSSTFRYRYSPTRTSVGAGISSPLSHAGSGAASVPAPQTEEVRRRFDELSRQRDSTAAPLRRSAPVSGDVGRPVSPTLRYSVRQEPQYRHIPQYQAPAHTRTRSGDSEFGSVVETVGGTDGGEDTESMPELPPEVDDDVPVVPSDLIQQEAAPLQWENHPAHRVVLALLERRGVTLPQFADLVEYHMAASFLDCIAILMGGAYFVRYGEKGTAPKERFARLRVLVDDYGRPVPALVITIHESAVQVIDRIRIEDLVGVTHGVDTSPAFKRHLVHYNVIKGSFVGQHRARLSTKGAFTLWFYDRRTRRPRALDLLTTNMCTHEVWTKALEGVLAVNSTCVHRSNVAQEMQRLFRLAQEGVAEFEEED